LPEAVTDDATLSETLLISGNEATGFCFADTTAVEFETDRSGNAAAKMPPRDDAASSDNSRGRGKRRSDDN